MLSLEASIENAMLAAPGKMLKDHGYSRTCNWSLWAFAVGSRRLGCMAFKFAEVVIDICFCVGSQSHCERWLCTGVPAFAAEFSSSWSVLVSSRGDVCGHQAIDE